MKKFIPILLSLLLPLAFFRALPLSAYSPVMLHFREVIPLQRSIESLSFPLSLADAEEIYFFSSPAVDQNTGKTIPEERFTFSFQQKTVASNQPLALSKTDMNNNSTDAENVYHFFANIEFYPSDPPGEYEEKVSVVYRNSLGESEQIPLVLKFKVLPWIRLQTGVPNPSMVISHISSPTETDLQSIEPVTMLVASNSPWLLYMRVERNPFTKTALIPIEISILESQKYEGFGGTFLPSEDFKLVAAGPPTVIGDGSGNHQYWTEMTLSGSISNCLNYPTGAHDFRFYFSGKTLD